MLQQGMYNHIAKHNKLYYAKPHHEWRDGDKDVFFDRREEHQFDQYQFQKKQHHGGFNPNSVFGVALAHLIYPSWWPTQDPVTHDYPEQVFKEESDTNRYKRIPQIPYEHNPASLPNKISHYH